MKKVYRIQKRKDFVDISRFGVCFRTESVVVQCRLNSVGSFRAGFTASKKVGNSVVRNRCKRRMRSVVDELCRKNLLISADYVFIARKKTFNVQWDILVGECVKAVEFLNKKAAACRKSISV